MTQADWVYGVTTRSGIPAATTGASEDCQPLVEEDVERGEESRAGVEVAEEVKEAKLQRAKRRRLGLKGANCTPVKQQATVSQSR